MKRRLCLGLVSLCLCLIAGLLNGCTAADPAESSLPQARPASWEGAPPLIGSPGRGSY